MIYTSNNSNEGFFNGYMVKIIMKLKRLRTSYSRNRYKNWLCIEHFHINIKNKCKLSFQNLFLLTCLVDKNKRL